jgi:hypothetical protein
VFNSPEQFKGCGGNSVWDLNEVGTAQSGDPMVALLQGMVHHLNVPPWLS